MAEPPVVLVHEDQGVRICHNIPIIDSVRGSGVVHLESLLGSAFPPAVLGGS
jgi:hypothetical protein